MWYKAWLVWLIISDVVFLKGLLQLHIVGLEPLFCNMFVDMNIYKYEHNKVSKVFNIWDFKDLKEKDFL